MHIVRLILAYTVVPIISLLITYNFYSEKGLELLYAVWHYQGNEPELTAVVNFFKLVTLDVLLCLLSIFLAFLIVGIFHSTAFIAGSNRSLNAKLFPQILPVTTIFMFIQVVIQAAIILISLYLLYKWYGFENYFFFIVIAVSVLPAIYPFVSFLFKDIKEPPFYVQAISVSQKEAPKLWEFVEQIAIQLGSKKPDNIILGLDPNFFACASEVEISGTDIKAPRKILTGETLYLSLSLLRIFTKDEVAAVIGHELGHFVGKDTEYAIKFQPVYRKLDTMMDEIDKEENILLLPTYYVLISMREAFAKNVSKINRIREFEADNIGISVTSPKALGIALTKLITYSVLYGHIYEENLQRLNKGKSLINFSHQFKVSCFYQLSRKQAEEIVNDALSEVVTHPFDSHPILSDRLNNIGYDYSKITHEELEDHGEDENSLIDTKKLVEMEEGLSSLLANYAYAAGWASFPSPEKLEEFNNREIYMLALYNMAACMIGADGKILQSEIAAAEEIGIKMTEGDFDRVDFRAYIDLLDQIPDFLTAAQSYISQSSDFKKSIHDFLYQIAIADGEMAREEENLLDELAKLWSLND